MRNIIRVIERRSFAVGAGGLLTFALLLTGCESRPHAPAIQDEAVFQHEQEGFRFLAPEGWVQQARAVLPAGKVTEERLLVEYQCSVSRYPASLDVSRIDLPEAADLQAYLQGPSFGVAKWRNASGPEKLEINGQTGFRWTFSARQEVEMTKEVTVFRQGERVYLFSGVFATADAHCRDEIRRTTASVLWRS